MKLLKKIMALLPARILRAFGEELLKDDSLGFKKLIQEHATKMAMAMISNWLDRKQIRHCAVCPGTDQLENVGGHYWCHGHAPEARKELEKATTVAA